MIGDVPSATAILDRFLHHAEIIQITGRSYRLRGQTRPGSEDDAESKAAKAPTGPRPGGNDAKAAKAPTGSEQGEEADPG